MEKWNDNSSTRRCMSLRHLRQRFKVERVLCVRMEQGLTVVKVSADEASPQVHKMREP